MLHQAGVRFALTTDHPVVPVYLLVLQAALAVKHGLPHEAALHALTAGPASILGLDDRVGSLRPGADADVVVWSGDPLDNPSRVEAVIIDGRLVYTWDPETRDGTVWERTARFPPACCNAEPLRRSGRHHRAIRSAGCDATRTVSRQ